MRTRDFGAHFNFIHQLFVSKEKLSGKGKMSGAIN